jgi:biotin carboxyl carrier protein
MIDRVTSTKTLTHSGKGVIAAHLPGLILEIFVKSGDRVKSGDLVIKMEAMKMVNEVRSRVDGTVKDILVAVQQNVLENQPLLIIE